MMLKKFKKNLMMEKGVIKMETKFKYISDKAIREAEFNMHYILKLETAYQIKRIADAMTSKRKRK